MIITGAAAAEAASLISADLCLLVTTGIHEKEGLTFSDPDGAAIRRILISRAAETYVVGSLEKIGTVARYTITGLSDVAGVVTDAPSYHPTIAKLRQQGITLIQAA